MSLIDAFMAVSSVVAVMLFGAAFLFAAAFAVGTPVVAAIGVIADGPDWPWLAQLGAWWLTSLVALVLLVWIDGNVEPWWPR